MRKWACLGCMKPLTELEERSHLCPAKAFENKVTGLRFVQCPECKTWPATAYLHHCLIRRKGKIVDVSKRRWDSALGAWVLDLPTLPTEPERHWDSDKKEFVVVKKDDFYASSCEVPPRDWKTDKKEKKGYSSYGQYSSYKPCYPWEKIDRNKWPSTWWSLFYMYNAYDWYTGGKYISPDDWEARLKGEYRKEPPSFRYNKFNTEFYGC